MTSHEEVNDDIKPVFDFDCCVIPPAVDARTIQAGCDRRAFARRNLRAGEVILRNRPTAHALLREYRQERCARCLSRTRRGETPQSSQPKQNLLRCGGCKQVWYCSRDCQKSDFFYHKVECKQSSILFSSTATGEHGNGGGGGIHNATLLVRNFLALRVPQNSDKSDVGASNDRMKCHCYGGGSIVHCGSNHFDNLIKYGAEYPFPLDDHEMLDIQRASRALWNHRKAINKTSPSENIIHSHSDLMDQLEGDLRRFRANNFGVTDSMVRVVASAVYPLGAMLNHSCAPNCLLRYDLDSSSVREGREELPVMEVVAARDIGTGEELTHSYVELVSPRQSRRASLRDVFGFDCHCSRCSFYSGLDNKSTPTNGSADGTASTFQISLPNNYRSMSHIDLSRWVLKNYNPSSSTFKRHDNNSLMFADQDEILQQPNNTNYLAVVEAANTKQKQAQYLMMTGDLDGELACLKEGVRMLESSLEESDTGESIPLSLELYKIRCTRFGSLLVAGGESYSKEALIECEHIVSFLCLALKHVPNHSLLGLQLFTLGDVYEANGEREKAQSTYIWARKILTISQGSNSDMVLLLDEKIR